MRVVVLALLLVVSGAWATRVCFTGITTVTGTEAEPCLLGVCAADWKLGWTLSGSGGAPTVDLFSVELGPHHTDVNTLFSSAAVTSLTCVDAGLTLTLTAEARYSSGAVTFTWVYSGVGAGCADLYDGTASDALLLSYSMGIVAVGAGDWESGLLSDTLAIGMGLGAFSDDCALLDVQIFSSSSANYLADMCYTLVPFGAQPTPHLIDSGASLCGGQASGCSLELTADIWESQATFTPQIKIAGQCLDNVPAAVWECEYDSGANSRIYTAQVPNWYRLILTVPALTYGNCTQEPLIDWFTLAQEAGSNVGGDFAYGVNYNEIIWFTNPLTDPASITGAAPCDALCTASATPSASVPASASATPTATTTPQPSVSNSAGATPSATAAPSVSSTASETVAPSASATPSATASHTIGATPSMTESISLSPSGSAAPSPSVAPSSSVTASPTRVPTPSPTAQPCEIDCVHGKGYYANTQRPVWLLVPEQDQLCGVPKRDIMAKKKSLKWLPPVLAQLLQFRTTVELALLDNPPCSNASLPSDVQLVFNAVGVRYGSAELCQPSSSASSANASSIDLAYSSSSSSSGDVFEPPVDADYSIAEQWKDLLEQYAEGLHPLGPASCEAVQSEDDPLPERRPVEPELQCQYRWRGNRTEQCLHAFNQSGYGEYVCQGLFNEYTDGELCLALFRYNNRNNDTVSLPFDPYQRFIIDKKDGDILALTPQLCNFAPGRSTPVVVLAWRCERRVSRHLQWCVTTQTRKSGLVERCASTEFRVDNCKQHDILAVSNWPMV